MYRLRFHEQRGESDDRLGIFPGPSNKKDLKEAQLGRKSFRTAAVHPRVATRHPEEGYCHCRGNGASCRKIVCDVPGRTLADVGAVVKS